MIRIRALSSCCRAKVTEEALGGGERQVRWGEGVVDKKKASQWTPLF